MRRTASSSALSILSECRPMHTHGAPDGVRAQFVLQAFVIRHEVKRDESFLMASELHTPRPAHPDGGAPDNRVVSVCVELVVDIAGQGPDAGVLQGRCPLLADNTSDTVQFLGATLETVRQ